MTSTLLEELNGRCTLITFPGTRVGDFFICPPIGGDNDTELKRKDNPHPLASSIT